MTSVFGCIPSGSRYCNVPNELIHRVGPPFLDNHYRGYQCDNLNFNWSLCHLKMITMHTLAEEVYGYIRPIGDPMCRRDCNLITPRYFVFSVLSLHALSFRFDQKLHVNK